MFYTSLCVTRPISCNHADGEAKLEPTAAPQACITDQVGLEGSNMETADESEREELEKWDGKQ